MKTMHNVESWIAAGVAVSTLLLSPGAWAQQSGTAAPAPTDNSALTPQPLAPTSSAVSPDDSSVLNTSYDNPDKTADLRGVAITLSGGVEGYTGALAPRVRPGEAYGLNVAFRITKVFGIELGYSGALHQVSDSYYPGAATEGGPDIIRNGGTALATFGLTETHVQPYLLVGLGINHYSIRGGQSVGFQDSTEGAIPAGAGLRGQFGPVIVDARFTYAVPFGQQFAPGTVSEGLLGLTSSNSGRYQATLGVGLRF